MFFGVSEKNGTLRIVLKVNIETEENKMGRFFKRINVLSFTYVVTMLVILLSIIGCGEETMNLEEIKFSTVESVSEEKWQKLSAQKIFFGHQSVGNNIIEGISAIKEKYTFVKLNILEGRDSDTFSNGVFAHDKIGDNHDPISKIDDLYTVIKTNGSSHIDVAFLKLCFVDVDSTSDVDAIFNYYRTKMKLLKEEFPETLLVHFTVPLLRAEKKLSISSVKKMIKKSLGKKSNDFFDDENNIARNRFNYLLVSEYEGKEAVFDIAKIESTKLDGQRTSFRQGGKIFYSLVPDYTNDGGHLNEKGRKVVAEQLLVFLASLSE